MSEEIWNGNEGTLCVYVSKAKDLPNLIKLDKQNVMLRLRIAHMTRESDVKFRAGQNPLFNYLEKFEITPSVKPIMYVEVYCERRKKAPLPIGRCEIDLMNGIRADPKDGYCTWYELKRDGNEFAGTIFIELTFKPNMRRGHYEKVSKDTMRSDASVAARPIPPLPTESRISSNIMGNSSYGYNHGMNEMLDANEPHMDHSEPEYMHASAMRQVTPSLPDYSKSWQGSESYPREEPYNNNNGDTNIGVPNFTSSVDTNHTTFTQETSSTTVTSTSAETRFHFANLKKLKERINIFKNPNMSVNKDPLRNGNLSPQHDDDHHHHSGVDIEALEKAIGVTSMDDDESSDDFIKDANYNGSSDSRGSYRRPIPPVETRRQETRNCDITIDGSRRTSDRRSPTTRMDESHRSPILPNLPDDVSFSSSLSNYRRNSNAVSLSSLHSDSAHDNTHMKLPPLPDGRIISSLSHSGSPRIPRLPSPTRNTTERTQSSSPSRRPLPPGY